MKPLAQLSCTGLGPKFYRMFAVQKKDLSQISSSTTRNQHMPFLLGLQMLVPGWTVSPPTGNIQISILVARNGPSSHGPNHLALWVLESRLNIFLMEQKKKKKKGDTTQSKNMSLKIFCIHLGNLDLCPLISCFETREENMVLLKKNMKSKPDISSAVSAILISLDF